MRVCFKIGRSPSSENRPVYPARREGVSQCFEVTALPRQPRVARRGFVDVPTNSVLGVGPATARLASVRISEFARKLFANPLKRVSTRCQFDNFCCSFTQSVFGYFHLRGLKLVIFSCMQTPGAVVLHLQTMKIFEHQSKTCSSRSMSLFFFSAVAATEPTVPYFLPKLCGATSIQRYQRKVEGFEIATFVFSIQYCRAKFWQSFTELGKPRNHRTPQFQHIPVKSRI